MVWLSHEKKTGGKLQMQLHQAGEGGAEGLLRGQVGTIAKFQLVTPNNAAGSLGMGSLSMYDRLLGHYWYSAGTNPLWHFL